MDCLICNSEFKENRICSLNTVCENCCNLNNQNECFEDCKTKQIEKLKKIISDLKSSLTAVQIN
jgi:hypothetical protein